MLASTKSNREGHYKTFLEECLNEEKTYGDSGQPTANTKKLGSCEFCSSYSFKSQDRKRATLLPVSSSAKERRFTEYTTSEYPH